MDLRPEKSSGKINLFAGFLALVFLLGLPLVSYGAYLKYQKTVLSFKGQAPSNAEISQIRAEKPVRIEITRLGINLPVEEATITNGVWQISETGVSHLGTSARPTEGDNIVLYGHNKKRLLGPIIGRIKVGDEIDVFSESGQKNTYKVSEVLVVSPNAIDVVYPTEQEVLTLYTCTGPFDSKRLVVKAVPITSSPH